MNPLQRAAWRRKAAYLVAIVGLFTVSMVWRGTLAVGSPARAAAPTPLHAAADWVGRGTILSQAGRLELRELDRGDPELAGSVARLVLVGSRGAVTTFLWWAATEKQKRGELVEFEKLARTVTLLQPHFTTPWLYQSWNIAYNVSVDQHRLGDMYFYIARGIELLAEGERRNRRNPDMRKELAFYYQNKFGVSDKVQTLRCLFQLSCLPPDRRSAAALRDPTGAVDPERFLEFCAANPHLARRLKERVNCRTPDDVVRFLAENASVPSPFKTAAGEFKDADQQFPALPPQVAERPGEWHPSEPAAENDSAFRAARAWYAYATVLAPPNPEDDDHTPVPSPTPKAAGDPGVVRWWEYDPVKYRVPRAPMLILFRQGPPRAQTYQAELEEKEGWFDESGWRVDEGADPDAAWFTDKDKNGAPRVRDVVLGGGTNKWALQAWQKAYDEWRTHGERYGLTVGESALQRWRDVAGEGGGTAYPPEPSKEQANDPDVLRRYKAQCGLYYYRQNRQVTNFPFFLASAEAERRPETVAARKTLWEAEQARKAGDKARAVRLYADGLTQWRDKVLVANPEFHRLEHTEEETVEAEIEFLRLLAQDDAKVRADALKTYRASFDPVRTLAPWLPEPAAIPEAVRQDLYVAAAKARSPFAAPMPGGDPWISKDVRDMVTSRMKVMPKPETPLAPPNPAR